MNYTGLVSNVPPARHRFWRWFYDRAAFAYDAILHAADRLHLGSEGRIHRQILGGLASPARSVVLDLGCGTAASRPYLPTDIHYIGLDISPGMLRRARAKRAEQRWHAHFVQADAQALPFAAKGVDLILAMGVLQHVSTPDSAIGEMLRVAKIGARLLLIDERRAQARILRALNRDNKILQYWGEYFVLDLQV